MLRSFFGTLALTIALTAGVNAAQAAGYDSGWQQATYRTSSYEDNSYSSRRVLHRARVSYTNSAYTVRRRIEVDPCQ